MISIIIPTLNERAAIDRTLNGLARAEGDFEVIIADGESDDATGRVVAARIQGYPHPLRFVPCPRQRALQLDRGADAAAGNILLFLHADTDVPRDAITRMQAELGGDSVVGGNFQVIFAGASWVSRVFTWIYRVRRPLGIYYGDSGIFVRREIFNQMGGFKPIPIMDDYEFVRRLERAGTTVCVNAPLLVSDRRWRLQGLFKTVLSWVWIQTLFSLGVSPERLAAHYRPVREANAAGSSIEKSRAGKTEAKAESTP